MLQRVKQIESHPVFNCCNMPPLLNIISIIVGRETGKTQTAIIPLGISGSNWATLSQWTPFPSTSLHPTSSVSLYAASYFFLLIVYSFWVEHKWCRIIDTWTVWSQLVGMEGKQAHLSFFPPLILLYCRM